MKKLVLPAAAFLLLVTSFAASGRKVLKTSAPVYPPLARQMQISGTVKLEATVSSSGKVKDVKVIGGHPVFSAAAIDAAKRWQYEPAPEETVETISVTFNSNQ